MRWRGHTTIRAGRLRADRRAPAYSGLMLNDDLTAPSGLRCPKCQGGMKSFERNGIFIDRCTQCGGLFLDRGELERLVEAEAAYYSRPPAGAAAMSPGAAPIPPGAMPPPGAVPATGAGTWAGAPYGDWRDDPRGDWRDGRGRGWREEWDDDDDDDDDYRRRGRRRRGFLDDLLDFG